jgi:hypothetical protein
MIEHHRTRASALAGLAVVTAALTGAGPAGADPPDPTPVPEFPVVVPAGDTPPPPPPPPPARDPFAPYVPEIQNPTYGSGNSGGGVFGTLKDLWQQVQNPMFAPNEIMGAGGAAPAPPPGSAAPPPLPPGYVSINLPGSETPVTATGPGSAPVTGPALPEGYYPLTGPPPPGYSYSATPGAAAPGSATPGAAAPPPVVTTPTVPSP